MAFGLEGDSWPFPNFDNADVFVERLRRVGYLRYDPLVEDAWHEVRRERSQRTLQRHFLQATGLRLGEARQIERARHATYLLRQGHAITDVVAHTGYYDQAHLTHALKQYMGQTPGEILRHDEKGQMSFLYKTTTFA
ncbi:MAG: AraC family transcriptional regulator [Ktedonobacteraceae bacterium]|nr:AraC family transcriptional regulator [Ktedonobacteraceae bacterium]MBA3822565.1 AraC family transcriptional regulator [Ktedonobacterales bacterium]